MVLISTLSGVSGGEIAAEQIPEFAYPPTVVDGVVGRTGESMMRHHL